MPVNLDRVSLLNLFRKEHFILEKSDGIRYLFSYDSKKFSIIDRTLKSHNIFPHKNWREKSLNLIDGELTFNLVLEKYKYLIYDAGIIKGDWRISSWDLYSRFRAVDNFLAFFYKEIYFKDKFFVGKLFFYKYNLKKILEAISINYYTKEHVFFNVGINNLFHCNKNDGIIFSPLLVNYSLKTTCTTFKWKYEFENTMDLLIQNRNTSKITGVHSIYPITLASMISKNKLFRMYKGKKLTLIYKNQLSSTRSSKKIGEFRYLQKKGSWVLKKYRFDKSNPNSFRVLCNTLKIISESITRFELIDSILKHQIRKERGKCSEKY